MKTNKWRVGVAITEFYMVEVESWSEAEALELAFEKIDDDPTLHVTSFAKNVTSIYLNDKESRGFAPFVADYMSDNEELNDFL